MHEHKYLHLYMISRQRKAQSKHHACDDKPILSKENSFITKLRIIWLNNNTNNLPIETKTIKQTRNQKNAAFVTK